MMRTSLVLCGLLAGAMSMAYGADAPAAEPAARPAANVLVLRSGLSRYLQKAIDTDVFRKGALLFTDRNFTVAECPPKLEGLNFLRGSIDAMVFEVQSDGVLTVLTPSSDARSCSRAKDLEQYGFERVDIGVFQLFGQADYDRVWTYRKPVKVGERYHFGKWVVVLGVDSVEQRIPKPWNQNTGELLYNGIRLPQHWPPNDIDVGDHTPMEVPYLYFPPAVIPINVGRQLFVDDFLVESTTLARTFHAPVKYEGNPVLRAETPVEHGQVAPEGHIKPYGHGNAGAVPKSGGCWWDPDDQVYKLWYETSWFGPIALATSRDGIHWDRPELDVLPGTNIASPHGITPDSWTVVRNWNATDPEEKWTLFVRPPHGVRRVGGSEDIVRLTSADGVHWNRRTATGGAGDRSTHHYNPFRNKWVFSLRSNYGGDAGRGRARAYTETDDFMEGRNWQQAPVPWLMTDERDPTDYLIREKPQLYNFDAVAYESIMLGWFQIHHGPPNHPYCRRAGLPKITELMYAFSRDGFHYDRPDRRAHIAASRGDFWDRGYVQSLGNICVIHGDRLFFYFSGYAGNPSRAGTECSYYDHGATGLAVLRRDGFASMDAGTETGTLTTRPVTFSGTRLFVNAGAPAGSLRAEIRDERGSPIEPFTLANSIPFSGDETLTALAWRDGADLSELAGQPVRFHFELTNGSLFAFWVSRDESGRSDGYVAGGGPGYTGPTDTVGRAALTKPIQAKDR